MTAPNESFDEEMKDVWEGSSGNVSKAIDEDVLKALDEDVGKDL